ncbi:MAG TPA: S24 family peptidase [Patescibacteria group bacterium]|nr:S24 family peptidase [Gammaproteobacteria bacterium]HWA52494.1 S24 family peptidase [Patescibacteria group bacterium]
MKNSLISKVLKILMFKKNINTTQLARDLDLPQQTLQRIVSGTSPNPHIKNLKPIADFFNISLEQLRGEQPLPEFISDINLPNPTKSKARQLPKVFWEDIEIYLNNPEKYKYESTIFVDDSAGNKTFALTLGDSSMEPYFPINCLLILNQEKNPKDRSFVLMKIGDSKTYLFRQLLIDGEYKYLKALNPDLSAFPMRFLGENDEIIATMTEFRHLYD